MATVEGCSCLPLARHRHIYLSAVPCLSSAASLLSLRFIVGIIPLLSSTVSKLAGRGEALLPLDSEREDSGIDSDAERCPAHRHHSSEDSGSDDDPVVKVPWVRVAKNKNDGFMKDMDDGHSDGSEVIPMRRKDSFYGNSLEPDRNSPPLYEVELTASDEDDDASVLELVIPVQTSRYMRVPTSSPKKSLKLAPTLFNLFCCLRK